MNFNSNRKVTYSICKLAVLTMFVMVFTFVVQGQVSGGSISGTVRDGTGAVVPKASIAIRNNDTGVTREQVTNADGEFTVPNLLPGNYKITCSATGFASIARSGITVGVGSQLVIDLPMTVGQVTETLDVDV